MSAPRPCRVTLMALLLLGCATEQRDNPDFEDSATTGGLKGLAPSSAGANGSLPMAGKPSSTANGGRAGNAGSTSQAGKNNGGTSQGGTTGSDDGGEPSEAGADPGNAGSAGMPNQPSMCDEATATVLGTMSANTMVASNACLKMSVPADQTWIKKLTLQPEGGAYPLPFTWSNCGTNSSGAFTANYANQILTPVNLQCPVLVKLGGTGSMLNMQWWGG